MLYKYIVEAMFIFVNFIRDPGEIRDLQLIRNEGALEGKSPQGFSSA